MSYFPQLDRSNWREWQEYLFLESWWDCPNRQKDEFHSNSYHGNFIPQIPEQMLLRYTDPYDIVFDPFLGSGTSLIEATLMGRQGIGAELVPEVFEDAAVRIKRAWKSLPKKYRKKVETYLHQGDWRPLELVPQSINLTFFHPPYYNVIRFSEDPACWSNLESIPMFLRDVRIAAHKIHKATVIGGHICIVIADCWDSENKCLRPLAFETLNQFQAAEWKLRASIVKNMGQHTRGKGKDYNLWTSRHVKNGTFHFAHEHIFVMQREK